MKRFPGLACLFLLAACTVFRQWEERIEFVRLYKHEVGHYSVDIKTPDGKIISRDLCNPLCPQKMDIFDDVGDGKQMWMRIVLGENVIASSQIHYVEIHIRSVADIQGAGWNRGKFGRGITHVVR